MKKIMTISALVLVLGACSSAPIKNAQLDKASALVAELEVSPEINASPSALVHLQEAKDALAEARKAEEVADVEHYASLAEQKAKIAVEMGKRKAAEKEAESLAKAQTEAVLSAREREIMKAKAETEAKAREAEARAREAQMALDKARELEKQLADLQAQQTERGMVLTLGDVLFETAKANLLPDAMTTISKLAAFMQEYPQKTLLIEGHTDSQGSEEYNLTLSRNRAESVYAALLGSGVASNRMRTVGYGESRPVASNDTSSGRQRNRRVEIVIQ